MNAAEKEELEAWLDLATRSAGNGKGAAWLAKALGHHGTLTMLYLYHKSISADGAKWLAESLKCSHTLTVLDLSHNSIGDEGAKQLAEALEQNTTLTWLDLRDNSIGDEGAKRLVDALNKNESLTALYLLSGNPIGEQCTGGRLREALNRNKTLTSLRQVGKLISTEDTKRLAEEHAYNKTETNHAIDSSMQRKRMT